MLKMGFNETWTNWVMICVCSVVRINGQNLEPFCPSRDLRQGDPLSPYLFLFVGEALASILKTTMNEGKTTPIKVAKNAPGVSNIMFADDSLLSFKATSEEA
jgi:hypothetical protein